LSGNTFILFFVATYEPKSVANFFIEEAAKKNRLLTPLELMKVVYLAHGLHLGITGRPLLNEPPQAFEMGPVFPTLYDTLAIYGSEPIPKEIPGYPVPREIVDFLRSVWQIYEGFSPTELTALTNQPGTPWAKTWEEKGKIYPNGVDIPEDDIRDYYRSLTPNATPQPAGT
jgi:uncharacterized phage-associated protein